VLNDPPALGGWVYCAIPVKLMGWLESEVVTRFWIGALVFALFALTTLKLR